MAPGVGFEPTRPEGPQADRRAYSRHGPARYADCPVPGSGIPAYQTRPLQQLFFPFGNNRAQPPRDPSDPKQSRRQDRRRMTRVAMGAGQPTTLDGRMAVPAPGGRHPYETLSEGTVLSRVLPSPGGTRNHRNLPLGGTILRD